MKSPRTKTGPAVKDWRNEPRKADGDKYLHAANCRVDERIKELLDYEAKRLEKSKSDLLRFIIGEYFNQ